MPAPGRRKFFLSLDSCTHFLVGSGGRDVLEEFAITILPIQLKHFFRIVIVHGVLSGKRPVK